MNKLLGILTAALILFSGCVGERTVKNGENISVKTGDNISVDYTGSFENGKIFDTSIEKVAKENNLSMPGRDYKPLKITAGEKEVIEGFDEGVIGMKVGETRTLVIPPEKGYPYRPEMVQVYPIIQNIPATQSIPKINEMPISQFTARYGTNHTIGDIIKIPETNLNITIKDISKNVSFTYNLKPGNHVWQSRAPWNYTVVKIDDKNITIKADLEKNAVIQFPGAPWNTTVIDINSTNITMRHNAVPDTEIKSMFGATRVHFNETSIIMDENSEVAGKILIFNVTLKSIDR